MYACSAVSSSSVGRNKFREGKKLSKLKYRGIESPPQAKNKFFYNICHSRKHTINEIMNESEIQVLGMPIAGEFFYNNCHSRTQIINEIISEIEIQKR